MTSFLQRLRPRGVKERVDGRGWPSYLFGGRVRTSTATLVVAFIVLAWVQQTFAPEPTATQAPASQVVPPGFVPDPGYTWVPRTQVQAPRTTRFTPTTTTTTTEPTTTTETTETTTTGTTSPTSPTPTTPSGVTTTVIDPDGPGLLPPQTLTVTPTLTPTPLPGPGPLPTTPAPPP